MDWGIVASVMVALALFTAAIVIIMLMGISLFVWLVKKHASSQGGGFTFPGCPLMKSTHDAR
jgi:hypothetical protein